MFSFWFDIYIYLTNFLHLVSFFQTNCSKIWEVWLSESFGTLDKRTHSVARFRTVEQLGEPLCNHSNKVPRTVLRVWSFYRFSPLCGRAPAWGRAPLQSGTEAGGSRKTGKRTEEPWNQWAPDENLTLCVLALLAVMSSVRAWTSHRHQKTPLLLQSPQTAQEPRNHGDAPSNQQQVGHGERREGQWEVRDLSLAEGKPHPYTKQATPTQLFTRQAQVRIKSGKFKYY